MSPSVPNDRLPSFDLLSHAWLHDGIAHPKTTVVLNQRGIRQVGQATERSVNDLVSLGLSFSSAARLHEMIRKLLALPPGRLRQIGFMDNADRYQLPRLPAEAIISLCYAASVDDEIEALVWDQNPRNSEAVLARWGYRHDGPMTLEAVGAAFGVTRERARQVVQRQEEDLIRSRVTLPFASGLIHDLEEAGGALPDDNFRTLLRYGLIEVSPQALTLLPELARLGCVPTVSYRADVDLWFTTTGATEWMESGKVDGIKEAARQAARPTLRSLGAVSVLGIQDCSPFGLEHVLHLIRPANSELVRVGHWAVLQPARDSSLLRLCRKVLAVTARISLADLHAGLMHSSRLRGLSVELLDHQLMRSGEFEIENGFVSARVANGRLSGAERIGVDVFEANGGAILWGDFIREMVHSGVSAPMASIVLKKPFVRQIGPGTYMLRGRVLSEERRADLRRQRRRLGRRGSSVISKTVGDDGVIVIVYSINDFTQQGVLTAPTELRGTPRHWYGTFPDGTTERISIANGFIWPLYRFFGRAGVRRGDAIQVRFDLVRLTVSFEHHASPNGRPETRQNDAPARSREEQILRALFENM